MIGIQVWWQFSSDIHARLCSLYVFDVVKCSPRVFSLFFSLPIQINLTVSLIDVAINVIQSIASNPLKKDLIFAKRKLVFMLHIPFKIVNWNDINYMIIGSRKCSGLDVDHYYL